MSNYIYTDSLGSQLISNGKIKHVQQLMNLQLLYEMNILSDWVNLQGDIIRTATGSTINSLFSMCISMSTCFYFREALLAVTISNLLCINHF